MRLFNLFRRGRPQAEPEIPQNLRLYAIGDIHGRLDLLEELQERLIEDAPNTDDVKIVQIFIGDYVDRGWDSKGVIDFLLAPPPANWARICLKGNHEAMLLDFLGNPQTVNHWQQHGGLETLQSYGIKVRPGEPTAALESHQQFLTNFPASHKAFFSGLRLSVEFGDYFFAHAGVRPYRRLDRQREEDLLWIRDEFLESRENFGKIVVHGHSPTEEPEILENRINIDTGAYITGRLTALVLDGNQRKILSTASD